MKNLIKLIMFVTALALVKSSRKFISVPRSK